MDCNWIFLSRRKAADTGEKVPAKTQDNVSILFGFPIKKRKLLCMYDVLVLQHDSDPRIGDL